MSLIGSLIALYILCAMIGFALLAYRGGDNIGGETAGILLVAPLGMAYQIGALAREKGK